MSEVVSAAGGRMGTVTLTEFLLARIAEDEAVNADSHDLRAWHENGCGIHPEGLEETWCTCEVPARVLAECEAKRRLIKRFPLLGSSYGREVQGLLATVYADHPDYREEWKP